MYGLTMVSISEVAFVSLMKTPLLIWRSRKSWRILRGFGAILLILLFRQTGLNVADTRMTHPLIRMTKTSFGSASTKKDPSCLLSLFRRIFSLSASRYSLTYDSARLKMTLRFSLLAYRTEALVEQPTTHNTKNCKLVSFAQPRKMV